MKQANLIKALMGSDQINVAEVWKGSFRASNGNAVLTWGVLADGTIANLEASYVDSRWPRFRGDNFYPSSIKEAASWLKNCDPKEKYAHNMLSKFRDRQTDELERRDEQLREQLSTVRSCFYFTRDKHEEAHKIIEQYIDVISRFYKLMSQQEAQDRRK